METTPVSPRTRTMSGPMLQPTRVLFVCTGNSARSLLAEAVLRERGGPAFEVNSAGTAPKGVHPLTTQVLEAAGIPTAGLTSTGLDLYLGQAFDQVITVCDDARQVCPIFPGAAAARHWSIVDPAATVGTDDQRMDAFRDTLAIIEGHVADYLAETAVVGAARAST